MWVATVEFPVLEHGPLIGDSLVNYTVRDSTIDKIEQVGRVVHVVWEESEDA